MRKDKNSAKEQNNIHLLPRMLGHYKLQSFEVHKAWVKSPEVLKNCLTGLHFASEHVKNFEINHIRRRSTSWMAAATTVMPSSAPPLFGTMNESLTMKGSLILGARYFFSRHNARACLL